MDQIKIGKFIAERRKQVGLTQAQLAEQLNITDRAVSKWETGKTMPDSSIMLELCGILGISVNDLLSGEVVTMENNQQEMQKNLLSMIKEKEEADRRLLNVEIILGITTMIPSIALIMLAGLAPLPTGWRIALIALGFVVIIAGSAGALLIEQRAGYYECRACKHRYVPTYAAVLFAMHSGRTRFMKCPHCGKRTWQRKVISKE